MKRRIMVVAAALCLISCVSPSRGDPLDFDAAPLFGMIYDGDNQPCAGVALLVDGKEACTTDIRGRFVLPRLSRGDHRLEASKEGHEPLEARFEFLNRTDVLYLRMTSFAQLLGLAEAALEQRRWAEAEGFLARAEKLDSSDPVLAYLRALLAFRTERYQEAADRLERLAAEGLREPHVHLLLADLYEHHLDDDGRAAANLESYLRLRADPEAQRRLEDLRAKQP